MKFEDFKYERADIEKYEKEVNYYLDLINDESSLEDEIKAFNALFKLEDEISVPIIISQIRNSINTKDEYYDKENEFYNETMPRFQKLSHEVSEKLLNSKHKDGLEKEFGKLMFDQALVAKRTFHESIMSLLMEENKLVTEYTKLQAGAKIDFDGNTYNLSQMAPFTQSVDRERRKNASLAISKFYNDNLNKYDDIFDKLIKVRNEIAKKLNYNSFIELGYDRLGRTDYNYNDVSVYRKQILNDVTPLVNNLTERKAKRLNIENMQSYDLSLSFLSGNPTPKGDINTLVNEALNMYKEMSSETGEFFKFMVDKNLLDLESKDGKSPGGYCTFIPKYNTPFIFANFNGTSHDVDVLTHEAGHAFQVYMSKDLLPAYRWPTMEAAEIHSMSMEFLAWPWVNKFFKEDTDKYKFNHLSGAVSFLPYGALVDHFQHKVYSNVNLTKEERRKLWRDLEKKYLPFKKYDEDEFLNNGGFFFRQGHIFNSPFYYIDYTLAQVVALEYFNNSRLDFNKTLHSYINLCKLGGSKSFLGLLKEMNLTNPFKEGSIKEILKPVNEYLNSIDDLKL